jgi:ketosteroid isomerase-like protein
LSEQGSGYVRAAVRGLERKWQDAIVEHDVSLVDDLVADDFVGTSSTGRVGTKSTLLYEMRRDENTYKSATARNMAVRAYGQNVAVVTGVASENGTTPRGQRFSTSRRFTDTWMQRNGKWQCIASHATQLPKR